jgi:hypothetical protein
MHLNLGSIQLPLNAATKTFAILAKRGAGKSYTGAVMAEEFHKHNIPCMRSQGVEKACDFSRARRDSADVHGRSW